MGQMKLDSAEGTREAETASSTSLLTTYVYRLRYRYRAAYAHAYCYARCIYKFRANLYFPRRDLVYA